MNPIDDLFRDGLGARKAEVPDGLWDKIKAQQPQLPAEGEPIDYYFKDKLVNRTAPVPPGMWQRISAARSRKLFPWRQALAVAAAVLLLLAGYLAVIVPGEENTAPLAESTEQTLPDAPALPFPENTSPSLAEAAASTASPSATVEAGFAPGQDAAVANMDTEIGATASREIQISATPTSEKGNIDSGSGILTDKPAVITTDSEAQNQTLSTVTEPAPNSDDRAENGTNRSDVLSNFRPELYQVSELPSAYRPLSTLPTTPLTELKRYSRVRPLKNGAFKSSPRHRSQTELLFGVSYANQQFSLNQQDANVLRDAREVSEFPEAGYQITLRQTFRLGKRLRLLGGLTYAEIRNQFEFEELVNGTNELRQVNNHLRLLEAPLLLGYTLPGKRRLQVSLNAGPVVNLATAVNGRFLHPTAPDPLDLASEGQYRKNIGLGVMTSLMTTYLIGREEPFLLVVEPFFKSYLGSFTESAAPIQEKYWVAGMQLGVRKAF